MKTTLLPCLILESPQKLFLPQFINYFEKFGIEVHIGHCDQPNKSSKTEVLFVSVPPSSYAKPTTFDDRNLQPINLGNKRFLPVVAKFNYLSTTLSSDCTDNEDVVFQTKKAGNAFGAIRKCLFPNPNISVDEKRVVYEGLILCILLQGAESWWLTEKLFSMLRIFYVAYFSQALCKIYAQSYCSRMLQYWWTINT